MQMRYPKNYGDIANDSAIIDIDLAVFATSA